MTDFLLVAMLVAFAWLLAFCGWLADRMGDNPFDEAADRRYRASVDRHFRR